MKATRTKKSSLFVRLCIVVFSAYIVATLVSLQVEINTQKKQLALVNRQIEEQRIANKETERLLALGDNEDYLSRIARDKLDMGFPDERVFRDATSS